MALSLQPATLAAPVPAKLFVDDDGRIRKGEQIFNDWDSFFEADKTQTHQCGTNQDGDDDGHEHDHHGRELVQSHCTLSFSNPSSIYAPGAGPLYRIRVAVHVITSGTGSSATGYISPSCIQSGINMLNDDFRARAGTKAALAGSIDTNIEFVLASTNTHGSSTNGYQYINNNGWLNAHSTDTSLRQMWAQIYSDYPLSQYMSIVTKVTRREDGSGLLG